MRTRDVDELFYNGARLQGFEPRCCYLGDIWVLLLLSIHVDTMTTLVELTPHFTPLEWANTEPEKLEYLFQCL